MSWSYDSSLASNSDKVRFLVQDTDDADQLVQDEEIAFTLTETGNVYRAAASIARAIALKLGRRPSARLGQIGLDAHEQYEHYMKMAAEFESKSALSGSGGGAGVFAGGISKADKESREQDSDRVPSEFTADLHVN